MDKVTSGEPTGHKQSPAQNMIVSGKGKLSSRSWYPRYVLGLLLVVYTINFIDRQVLSILMEPIKHDLGLSDTQLGILSGIAFALFYATLGIPIAYLADRKSRVKILSTCMIIWSAMTAVCGLAGSYTHLLMARIGVGIGEAGGTPPSHSLIADYFPLNKRATALGVYSMGIPGGVLLGFLLGGWINEWFDWRTAFLVVGIPGVLIAALVKWTVIEPRRGHADGLSGELNALPLRTTIGFLLSRGTYVHITIAASLKSIAGYGVTQWLPAFFMRTHGFTSGEAGTLLALVIGFAGLCGTFAGGLFADRLAKRDLRWYAWMPGITMMLACPLGLVPFLTTDISTAATFLFLSTLLWMGMFGPVYSLIQNIAPPNMRAVASALLLFIVNLVGMGSGPWVVGMLSDGLASHFGADSLRIALLIVTCVYGWASIHFLMASRHVRRNVAKPQI